MRDDWARSCQADSMVGLLSVSNLDSCLCTLVVIFCVERYLNQAVSMSLVQNLFESCSYIFVLC